MELHVLESKIAAANTAYRGGAQSMPDAEYDELLEMHLKLAGPVQHAKFANSLNEHVVERGQAKVKHAYVMGSLDKLKSSDPSTLMKFIAKHVHGRLNVSAKVDGISAVAKYIDGKLVELVSRGDGYEGTSFMDKALCIQQLPMCIPSTEHELYVRGELVLKSDEDVQSATNFRNVCAGLMNAKAWSKDDVSKVSFIPYTVLGSKWTKHEQFEMLEQLGFEPAWHDELDVQLDGIVELLVKIAEVDRGYGCDGLVLMAADAHNEDVYRPKNAMAFKLNKMSAVTRIVDVDWSGVSKDGFIIPVFVLEPVELGGAVISRASASNLDVLQSLGAKYGSVVELVKANDIIPHVTKVLSNDGAVDIELPRTCPCCGEKLVRDGVNLRCINADCEAQTVQQTAFFIKKLGCKNAAAATLKKLGICTFENLMEFKPDMSKKTEASLSNELLRKVFTRAPEELLAAMNFVGLSETLISKIVGFYGLTAVENGAYAGMPDGVGEATLQKFKDSIQDNLRRMHIVMSDVRYVGPMTHPGASGDVLLSNGMSVCFTGKLETMARSDASKMAVAAGFKVMDNVKKGLTYLVTNDQDTSSSKGRAARKLGVQMLSEKQFITMCQPTCEDVMQL